MKSLTLRFGLLIVLICTALAAMAEPLGTSFTYQGELQEQGAPLDGQVDLVFSLFDVASEGVALDDQSIANVTVANGVFSVELDFGAEAFNGDKQWLGIAVRSPHDPTDTGDFTTLAPRQYLSATPYAIQTRGLFVSDEGNVGIGTKSPTIPLQVEANNGLAVSGSALGESGFSRGAFFASNSNEGTGLSAIARADNGKTYGVSGTVLSSEGIGVYGRANYIGSNHSINYGIFGETNSPNGYAGYFKGGRNYFEGKVGIGTDSPIYQFQVETTGGIAVYGKSTASAGQNSAGFFSSQSDMGTGVVGYAMREYGANYGVRGKSLSTSGHGVFGWASSTTGTNYGVYGQTDSPSGFAGYFKGGRNYFEGNVGIGIDSPTAKLELGGANANLLMYEDGGSPFMAMGDSSTTVGWLQWRSDLSRFDIYTYGYLFPIAIGPTGSGGIFVDTVNNGGNIGIGTEAPAFKLHVNGTAGKPGGGSWANSSDRRLKKNINDLSGSLDRLMQLRSVSFEYKDPDSINEMPGRHIGMIAQEVEVVFPEWVSEGRNGYKTLAFSGFEALTVNALRELRQEKDRELAEQLAIRDEQIKALRAANTDLESRLSRLEVLFAKGNGNAGKK